MFISLNWLLTKFSLLPAGKCKILHRSLLPGCRPWPYSPIMGRGIFWIARNLHAMPGECSGKHRGLWNLPAEAGPSGEPCPVSWPCLISSTPATPSKEAVDGLIDHGHQYPVGNKAGIIIDLAWYFYPVDGSSSMMVAVTSFRWHIHWWPLPVSHDRHRVHEMHANHFSGRPVMAAILVMEMDDVLVAGMQCAGAPISICLNISSFRLIFSVAASTTRSACLIPSRMLVCVLIWG